MGKRNPARKKVRIPSKAWLKEMIRDEHLSHKDYAKQGLKSIAKDEARHERILKKRMREIY